MTQAATEAAALEALELDYGHAYMTGHDDAHGWWAARRDQIGGLLTADTPEELRAAVEADHSMKPVTRLWCRACGKRAAMRGETAVHAASGYRASLPDGHHADPVTEEPPEWKAAREITADYGGAFTVTARFGILRADWSPKVTGPWATTAHYEAAGDLPAAEADLRAQLDEAVRGTRWQREATG